MSIRTAPHQLDALRAARLIERRELSAEALLRSCLEHIAAREPAVQAFACLDADAALAQARALDAGPWRGPLHGLPLGVKDLLDSADLPTRYGSPVYAGYRPGADAAALALCREAGAVLAGKTVCTEFAYFHPGPTRNPHDLGHTPGGSSSGSAAAVADAMLPLALGTQTAGSIIRPAAYCGVFGYKPTLGRVPRAGVKSLSETMDTLGGFGRSVADVALLGSVLTSDVRLLDLPALAVPPRIGLCRTPEWPQADADVQRAWAQAEAALSPHAGALIDVDWPAISTRAGTTQGTTAGAEAAALQADWHELAELQKAVMTHEMARSLSHERVRHHDQLSPRLQALLAEGMSISAPAHQARLARLERLRRVADDVLFAHCDVLLAPSTTGVAPVGLGATGDPLFCRRWSVLGQPCIHLPFAQGATGLPVGLQLIARTGADHQLLATAQWCVERLTR
jgi:Asp-tRNA(Asn)/Glu-tRNA(Gln) amidotransferase A subunit family amidase